ncbi:MAG: hypothetical protein KBD62_32140 [Kofleriaceae bacterium]|nr:hypothetical protein [Kofleriaceae bacterium]
MKDASLAPRFAIYVNPHTLEALEGLFPGITDHASTVPAIAMDARNCARFAVEAHERMVRR